jgi:ABC-type transport system substrate-binding protein
VTLNVRPQLNGADNPLSNEKVRQAMNYAADKTAIIQIVTHGVGTPMTSFHAGGDADARRRPAALPRRRREG